MKSVEILSDKKQQTLKSIIKKYNKCIIALSGGIDSSFLLYTAVSTLGKSNVVAVTAKSPVHAEYQINNAVNFAKKLGVKHKIVETSEMNDPIFLSNPPDRCYYCKKIIFSAVLKYGRNAGISVICEGSNVDDTNDYRPGFKAVKELDIKSPLKEAGLNKNEIRYLAKIAGIEHWDLPSSACLASRIPYNLEITKEKLQRIENAEQFIKNKGFTQVRVRDHNDIARIELLKKETNNFFSNNTAGEISGYLKKLGWKYITIDIDGYRTGSLNLAIKGN